MVIEQPKLEVLHGRIATVDIVHSEREQQWEVRLSERPSSLEVRATTERNFDFYAMLVRIVGKDDPDGQLPTVCNMSRLDTFPYEIREYELIN